MRNPPTPSPQLAHQTLGARPADNPGSPSPAFLFLLAEAVAELEAALAPPPPTQQEQEAPAPAAASSLGPRHVGRVLALLAQAPSARRCTGDEEQGRLLVCTSGVAFVAAAALRAVVDGGGGADQQQQQQGQQQEEDGGAAALVARAAAVLERLLGLAEEKGRPLPLPPPAPEQEGAAQAGAEWPSFAGVPVNAGLRARLAEKVAAVRGGGGWGAHDDSARAVGTLRSLTRAVAEAGVGRLLTTALRLLRWEGPRDLVLIGACRTRWHSISIHQTHDPLTNQQRTHAQKQAASSASPRACRPARTTRP